jgi:hypothetical protein
MRLFRRKLPPFTLVFIHIPKTGGMSLREFLLGHYRKPTFWIVDPVKDTTWLRSIPREERERYSLCEGHMYYGVHELLPRPCVYMTMLRDPVERVLSYYSHLRGRDDHFLHDAVKDLSLADCFRRGLTVELDNYMVRALTSLRNVDVPFGAVTAQMLEEAKAHLSGMLVGITERFDDSMSHFQARLNWRSARAPRTNITAARIRREDLSPEDLDLLRQTNSLDAELYQYAVTLFEARLRGESTLVPIRPPVEPVVGESALA